MNPILEGISEPLAILLSWRTCRLGSVVFSLTFIHFHSFSLSVYRWKTPRSSFFFFLIKPWVSSLHKRGIHYLALCPHFVLLWSLLFILCDKTRPLFFSLKCQIRSLSQLNSVILAQNQPQTLCKWIGVAPVQQTPHTGSRLDPAPWPPFDNSPAPDCEFGSTALFPMPLFASSHVSLQPEEILSTSLKCWWQLILSAFVGMESSLFLHQFGSGLSLEIEF